MQRAAPFEEWTRALARTVSPWFGLAEPDQCIVNADEPAQGIGMHTDWMSFAPRDRVHLARRVVADALPAIGHRPDLPVPRHPERCGRRPPGTIRASADGQRPLPVDARHLPAPERGAERGAHLRHIPNDRSEPSTGATASPQPDDPYHDVAHVETRLRPWGHAAGAADDAGTGVVGREPDDGAECATPA